MVDNFPRSHSESAPRYLSYPEIEEEYARQRMECWNFAGYCIATLSSVVTIEDDPAGICHDVLLLCRSGSQKIRDGCFQSDFRQIIKFHVRSSVLKAIRARARERRWHAERARENIASSAISKTVDEILMRLTESETEVLRLKAEERTGREIAKIKGWSEQHVSELWTSAKKKAEKVHFRDSERANLADDA